MQEHQLIGGLANRDVFTETEILLPELEEIALLREQIESLMLELLEKNQELRELEEELQYTNEELCEALRLTDIVSFARAKKFAQIILENPVPSKEALAALLCAIYGFPVKPSDLQSIAEIPAIALDPLLRIESDRYCAHQSRLPVECGNLTKEQLANLQEKVTQLRAACQKSVVLTEKIAKIKQDYLARKKDRLQLYSGSI